VFDDRKSNDFKVYKLIKKARDMSKFRKDMEENGLLIQSYALTRANLDESYHFEPVFTFDIFESEFLKTKFGYSKNIAEDREKVDQLIHVNTIRLVLSNSIDGCDDKSVIVSYNHHDSKSTKVEVWGSIFHRDQKQKNFKTSVSFPANACSDIVAMLDQDEKTFR